MDIGKAQGRRFSEIPNVILLPTGPRLTGEQNFVTKNLTAKENLHFCRLTPLAMESKVMECGFRKLFCWAISTVAIFSGIGNV